MTGLTFARQILELTPEEVGKMVNITRPMISAWENGSKAIPEKRVAELARVLHIRPEFLQKTLTMEDQIQILLEMNQNHYENSIHNDTQWLMTTLGNSDFHNFNEEQKILYQIEVNKLLVSLSKVLMEKNSSYGDYLDFLKQIQSAVNAGGKYVKRMTEIMQEEEKKSIKYLLQHKK